MSNQKIRSKIIQQQATATENKQPSDSDSSIQHVPGISQNSTEVPEIRPVAKTQMLLPDHYSESSSRQYYYPPIAETSGLAVVLDCVQNCFEGRPSIHSTELLKLSLRHIFISTDLLYSTLLPELTTTTNQYETPVHDEDESLPETTSRPQIQYCIWSLLQEIEALSARLEPLCQLLNSAATDILEALDRSSSTNQRQHFQQEERDTDRTDVLAAIDVSHRPDNTYYQWMQAVRLLAVRLEFWQQTNKERLLFTRHFVHITPIASTLGQIDITLDALLQTMCAVFGTILPEFHTLEKGDDETIAMLLLDLIQKTDQTLLHMEALIEPLHALIQQYGTENTLQ